IAPLFLAEIPQAGKLILVLFPYLGNGRGRFLDLIAAKLQLLLNALILNEPSQAATPAEPTPTLSPLPLLRRRVHNKQQSNAQNQHNSAETAHPHTSLSSVLPALPDRLHASLNRSTFSDRFYHPKALTPKRRTRIAIICHRRKLCKGSRTPH